MNHLKIKKLNLLTNISLYYFSFFYFPKKKFYLITDKQFFFQRSEFINKNKYFSFLKIIHTTLFSKLNLLIKLNSQNTISLYTRFYLKYFIYIQLYLKKKFHIKKLKCSQFKTKIKNILFKNKLKNKKINCWFIKHYELNFFIGQIKIHIYVIAHRYKKIIGLKREIY